MDLKVLLGLAGILILVVLILMFNLQRLLTVLRGSDTNKGGTMNKFNAWMFVIFGVGGLILFLWYSFARYDLYTLPEASSEHGVRTDTLFWVTTVIVSIVFILTNLLLFGFAFKYRYKKSNKATFYPDNHVLELIWTVIPAIVLTYLVFNGWKEWTKITDEPIPQLTENMVELEVVGQQFYWNVRYPGADKELGEHSYKLIDATNAYGLKSMDPNAWDDFMPRKIYLAKGRKTHFVIRAKDVLHSVYAPHFRVKMDAMPGSPTEFWFTPTKTTQEMNSELLGLEVEGKKPITAENPFVYELACAEMCGKGHYSMRYEIVVLEAEDYDKWFAESSKKPWALSEAEYVWNKLNELGAPENIKSDFVDWVKDRDAELASTLRSTHFNSSSNTNHSSNGEFHESTDHTSIHDSLDVDGLLEGDNYSESEGEDKKGKLKNLLHKAGDVVEGHKERKADRNNEEYVPSENGLHKLGDKHEENKKK